MVLLLLINTMAIAVFLVQDAKASRALLIIACLAGSRVVSFFPRDCGLARSRRCKLVRFGLDISHRMVR
ncbi:MAG: hypothetical protein DME49_04695 [Verrucomicrobia bacterium]|nr:MAG: hypothetical protein DME49_04695 [Verrucomicrobiota bacterium]PYK93914.1 MAG: hypothetical protein DME36_07845 [Verrucomicrobiota bacterium]PYL59035.1 MAG: hypothetical protein DMF30_00845 [Verrucomicrobiota bacterium]